MPGVRPPVADQSGSPALYTPFGDSEQQIPTPTLAPGDRLPVLTQSMEEASCKGHHLSTSKHAERQLPASRWNLPPLPGPWPTRMPERGEFQVQPRPLPTRLCPAGCFMLQPGAGLGGKVASVAGRQTGQTLTTRTYTSHLLHKGHC